MHDMTNIWFNQRQYKIDMMVEKIIIRGEKRREKDPKFESFLQVFLIKLLK